MNDEKKLIWKQTAKKTIYKTPIFTIAQTESTSPEGKNGSFIVMDAPEWGIIIPVFEKNEERFFVMVKQWRHGSNSLSIEFPGGVMNWGENPEKGVARELAEETGFKAGQITHLATLSPNPAIMSNRLHIFVAEKLTDTKKQELDADEFVDVMLIPEAEVYAKMGHEPYIHAFMSTALFLYSQYHECRKMPSALTAAEINEETAQTVSDAAFFIAACRENMQDGAGTYENWKHTDTLSHIADWIEFSAAKLRAIAAKKSFTDIQNLDTHNRKNFASHAGESGETVYQRTLGKIGEYPTAALLFSEEDLARKNLPTGFSYELWRYMLLDTVIHPVMHMAYHLLKTRKYDEAVRLLKKRSRVFEIFSAGDRNVYSFAEYAENSVPLTRILDELAAHYGSSEVVQSVLAANGNVKS